MGDKSAWASPALGDAHLLAAVEDLNALGCVALEYYKAGNGHRKGSYHSNIGIFKYRQAADMNHDGQGDYAERDWFKNVGQKIAREHGLSITCGIYGYVEGHSPGNGMHMHIDVGPWSDLGYGDTRTSWVAHPTALPFSVRAFQKWKGLTVDGICGPLTTKALQKWVGTKEDGSWGSKTTKALQKKLGVKIDGIMGPISYGNLTLAVKKKLA